MRATLKRDEAGCSGCINWISPLDMPFMHHYLELNYLFNLRQLMARVADNSTIR